MSEPLVIDLFAEDHAHEAFLKPILARLCDERKLPCRIRVRSARGGHSRALSELDLYQAALLGPAPPVQTPDLVVVAIDANCQRHSSAQRDIRQAVRPGLESQLVIACPDPHVERWCLLDPESFAEVVGAAPRLRRKKCERGYYKQELAAAVHNAGHPPLLGGIEFAPDLAQTMNLTHAAQRDTSFRRFLEEARRAIAAVASPRG